MNANPDSYRIDLDAITRLREEAHRMRAEALRALFAQWRAALKARLAPRPASTLHASGCS